MSAIWLAPRFRPLTVNTSIFLSRAHTPRPERLADSVRADTKDEATAGKYRPLMAHHALGADVEKNASYWGLASIVFTFIFILYKNEI